MKKLNERKGEIFARGLFEPRSRGASSAEENFILSLI